MLRLGRHRRGSPFLPSGVFQIVRNQKSCFSCFGPLRFNHRTPTQRDRIEPARGGSSLVIETLHIKSRLPVSSIIQLTINERCPIFFYSQIVGIFGSLALALSPGQDLAALSNLNPQFAKALAYEIQVDQPRVRLSSTRKLGPHLT